jgi:two-component sensor histidine kinase
LGLGLSLPIILFCSALVADAMSRWPWLALIGAGVLGWVSGEMLVADRWVFARLEAFPRVLHYLVPLALSPACWSCRRGPWSTRTHAAALEDAHARVQAMTLLHVQLSRSQTIGEDVDLPAYLRAVVAAFRNGHPDVRVLEEFRQEGLYCDAGRAIPCGLIVTELLTNATKHAFPRGAPGEIGVGLSCSGENYELRVWDRGMGLPSDLNLERVASLGLKLVRLMAPRLRGSYSVSTAGGTVFTFTFPAMPPPRTCLEIRLSRVERRETSLLIYRTCPATLGGPLRMVRSDDASP